MFRFLFGMILGFVLSALGLGSVAVMNPLPGGPVSQFAPPEGAAASARAAAPAPQVAATTSAPAVDASVGAAAPSIGEPQIAGLTGSLAATIQARRTAQLRPRLKWHWPAAVQDLVLR